LQETGKKTLELTEQCALSLRVMLAASLQASYREVSYERFSSVVLDTFFARGRQKTLELTKPIWFSPAPELTEIQYYFAATLF
jgi:hypothetical protein